MKKIPPEMRKRVKTVTKNFKKKRKTPLTKKSELKMVMLRRRLWKVRKRDAMSKRGRERVSESEGDRM